MSGVSAILLAAGESKRMGVDKLSLPWGKKTVFEHCLETLLRSKVREVIVVLNDRREGKRKDFKDKRVKVVINPDYRKGMSTSIRKGLQAIDPRSQGILIGLGDQPFLRPRTINALINTFIRRGKGIVVPSFRGRRGHPVIFHRDFERELRRLRGDAGGRSVIERYLEEVWTLPVRSKGVVKDIDTWKDYEGARVGR